ncbi:hypothetical protein AB3N60_08405 [Leptospira sp. WS39.C2]
MKEPTSFGEKELKVHYRLQYEMDLPETVLKVGPNLQISIGKFALNSFNHVASQVFNVSSYSARNFNDPLEPASIVLRKVQVNRTLVFEEGSTKFQHATFASIVEFLLVKESGETYRILGKSDPIHSNKIPFSSDDTQSEEKIAKSIQSAIEIGLRIIIDAKNEEKTNASRLVFQ